MSFADFAPFETARLSLRPPEPRDARALARAFGDPAGAAAPARRIARARRDWLTGDAFRFVVRRRAGGAPVGLVELARGPRAACALSGRFAPARDRAALAGEAARWLAGFGRATLGLRPGAAAPRPCPGPAAARPAVYVAAAALTDDRGRVLLARRPPGKAMAGLWEFPGGKAAPGERPRETLARELAEELGLALPAAAFAPWDLACHAYDDFRLLMPLMRCRIPVSAPRPREGQDIRWTPRTRLPELAMPAANRPLAARLARTPPAGWP